MTPLKMPMPWMKAVKEAGIKFQMSVSLRFHSVGATAEGALRRRALGQNTGYPEVLTGARCPVGFLPIPKPPEAVLSSIHLHLADLSVGSSKRSLWRVYCDGSPLSTIFPQSDCGLLTLELANGAFMTIDPSWSRPDHPLHLG